MDDAELLKRLRVMLANEPARAPVRVDLPSALAEFKAWLLASGKTESSANYYCAALMTVQRGGLPILALDAARVISYAAQQAVKLEASTLSVRYSILRTWAEFTGQTHAVESLKAPIIDQAPKPLPPSEDVAAVRSLMRPSKHAHNRRAYEMRRDGTIYDLLFEGALRISEALGLDVTTDLKTKRKDGYSDWHAESDDALTHIYVRKSKRNKSRVVPLTPAASKSLAAWVRVHRPRWLEMTVKSAEARSLNAAVFTLSNGSRVDPESYRQKLRAYSREAGVSSIGGKTHTGRRFKITSLIVKGKAPSALIRFTGHASEKELHPYIVWNDDDAERQWLG